MVVSNANIDAAEVGRFSALAAEWWNPKGPLAVLHRLNPARLAYIRQQCLAHFGRETAARRPFRGLKLLDIGCGGGLVAEPMARLGFSVTAVDPSAEAVELARTHADEARLAIDYRNGGPEALPESGAVFDVVLALEVVEHAPDARAFLTGCERLIAPGGLLILSSLNRTLRSLALGKIAAEYLLRWAPAGTHDWRKFPKPAELEALLADLGLAPVTVRGLSFRPLAGVWTLTADASVNFLMTAAKPGGVSAAARPATSARSAAARRSRAATNRRRATSTGR
ncbi:MAG TPA: bifunctional 2-polyprenyl-6-hydroxyphenol methylase/3-demethylubiquinol 3-O-methyltransferase UbiG [Caulobacteraceae bacterium]|nr:bifunctional 2-polyprenyl-6-hydroxyphenol methylase/3-demethylubiquinol 3-O-methyltransferase UbiG [Caulobacteraceae bacterium]